MIVVSLLIVPEGFVIEEDHHQLNIPDILDKMTKYRSIDVKLLAHCQLLSDNLKKWVCGNNKIEDQDIKALIESNT